MQPLINNIFNEDCLIGMQRIPDRSVDMVLCDLPYAITDCKWDVGIDLDKLWEQYERILISAGVIVLHSVQPFTTVLINSKPNWFKYTYVWIKTQAANFQIAKYMPLKKHEDVCIFYKKKPIYNPQMWKGESKAKRIGKAVYQTRKTDMYLASKPANLETVISNTYFPTTVLNFKSVARNKSVHRTQKPVELAEFFMRTYTNEGATVLDNCIGSGTTAIACINTDRNYIGFEKDAAYFEIANRRILKHTKK